MSEAHYTFLALVLFRLYFLSYEISKFRTSVTVSEDFKR